MNANTTIIPFTPSEDGANQRLQLILKDLASGALSPTQLSILLGATAASLAAAAAVPAPAPRVLADPADPRLQVDRKEAARRLGYDASTVDRLVKRGQLHPNRATGHPRFSIKELQRFIDSGSKAI